MERQESIFGSNGGENPTNVKLSNRIVAIKVVDLYKLMQSKLYSSMGELEVGFPHNNQDDDNITELEGQNNEVSRR